MVFWALSGLAAKQAFPSELPPVVGVIVTLLVVPPVLAIAALIGELAALFRLSNRERSMRSRTGNPLIDHPGIGIVAGIVIVGVTLLVLTHPSNHRY